MFFWTLFRYQGNGHLSLLHCITTDEFLITKIKYHQGDIRILVIPRLGIAQNRLGTTDINDLLKELLNYLLY